jgi:hypothetical protein
VRQCEAEVNLSEFRVNIRDDHDTTEKAAWNLNCIIGRLPIDSQNLIDSGSIFQRGPIGDCETASAATSTDSITKR